MTDEFEIELIPATGFSELIKILLPKVQDDKSSSMQLEFLRLAMKEDQNSFPDWLFEKCSTLGTSIKIHLPEVPLSEGELCSPPINIEKKYWSNWKHLNKRNAAEPTSWVSIHLFLIRKGYIKSSWFAAKDQSVKTGLQNIDKALKSGNEEMTVCLRDIFRHLGGIRKDRGRRTAYIDCRTARGWWRRYFAERAFSMSNNRIDVEMAHNVLRLSGIWEIFCEYMISRLTAIGDEKLRSAIIIHLTNKYKENGKKDPVFQKGSFEKLMRNLGRRTVWQAMGLLPIEEIVEIVSREKAA